ncbi:hypothetical protein C0Q70_10964 [Pomacea canaliculata]|uniref:T-box domain-containing protein n=1 Tax=Pomacea canaliculata TaxID=400727 RepID=A0A2T7P4M5_POMCA|nr:hypothetical protein C0Q70_10964 [Pomacea canaliculata]
MLSVRAQNFSVARLLELKDVEQDANPRIQTCERRPADQTGVLQNDCLCVRRVLMSPHGYVVGNIAGCKHRFVDDKVWTDPRVYGGSEHISTCADSWQDRANESDAVWKEWEVTDERTKEEVDQSKKCAAVSPVSAPRFHGDEPSVSLLARKYSCGGQWSFSHSSSGVPLRMFPPIRLRFGGLEPNAHYTLWLEFAQCGTNKYRYVYHSSKWAVAGKAEPDHSEPRVYTHPDSPFSGRTLLSHGVSFERVKLTNNVHPSLGQVSLISMQKFQPRIHVEKMHKSPGNDATPVHFTFTFPQTSFIAVTAYQNQQQITQLKIARNPFAKGFRESGKSRHGVMAVFSSAFQERRTHQVNAAAAAEVQIVCPSVVSGHCLQESISVLSRCMELEDRKCSVKIHPEMWSHPTDPCYSPYEPRVSLKRMPCSVMLQEKQAAAVSNTINPSP